MQTNTAAIESLRTFAFAQCVCSAHPHDYANNAEFILFAHLCTAALAGEEWAVERTSGALKLIAARSASYRAHVAALKAQAASEHRNYFEFDAAPLTLEVIRSTDTTRPDGLIARGGIEV